MDHAGHSQPLPLSNQLLPSPNKLFTASQNNNWLTAVVLKDSNAKDVTVPGQNGLSITLTQLVLSLKVNIHTLPEEELARPPQLPENSLTQPNHGRC